jgi:hypothetical protein
MHMHRRTHARLRFNSAHKHTYKHKHTSTHTHLFIYEYTYAYTYISTYTKCKHIQIRISVHTPTNWFACIILYHTFRIIVDSYMKHKEVTATRIIEACPGMSRQTANQWVLSLYLALILILSSFFKARLHIQSIVVFVERLNAWHGWVSASCSNTRALETRVTTSLSPSSRACMLSKEWLVVDLVAN